MKKIIASLMLLSVSLFAEVNINKATIKDLVAIKGIGEKKAQAIVTYREANGEFKTVKEIMKVTGIGQKLFNQIKAELTVKEIKKVAKAEETK